MSINPEMMSGTSGVPEFVVVADMTINGAAIKVGIRQLSNVQGSYVDGSMMLYIGYRVRFQVDNGVPLDYQGMTSKLTATKPTQAKHAKVKSDYASYMLERKITTSIPDKDFNLDLATAKACACGFVADVLKGVTAMGGTPRYKLMEVVEHIFDGLHADFKSCGIDLGYCNDPAVPTKQDVIEKYNNKQASKAAGTSGTKTAPSIPTATSSGKAAGTGKANKPKKDKYAAKKVSEEDLSNMSFDQLMGAISKKIQDK
ncbi:hypothetical protein ACRXCV_00510 (plasmid) [Halobacteriovorax sp. GFR7]|uniref:hypothetical protein n=1 Tax=unclassified Halobacteriovorax TaxID=2639665 RepID=UPI003D998FF5